MASRLVRPNAAQAESLAELRRPIELRDRRVLMLAIGRVVYFVGVAYAIYGVRDSLVAWGSSLRELIGRLSLLPSDWFLDWPNFLRGRRGDRGAGGRARAERQREAPVRTLAVGGRSRAGAYRSAMPDQRGTASAGRSVGAGSRSRTNATNGAISLASSATSPSAG